MSAAYPAGLWSDDDEIDPEFDAWDIEVLCEVCTHYHGGEEECLPHLHARPTPCGDIRCCQP